MELYFYADESKKNIVASFLAADMNVEDAYEDLSSYIGSRKLDKIIEENTAETICVFFIHD